MGIIAFLWGGVNYFCCGWVMGDDVDRCGWIVWGLGCVYDGYIGWILGCLGVGQGLN